jgi:hypothetical protein
MLKLRKFLSSVALAAGISLSSASANACLSCEGGACTMVEGWGFTNCWYVNVVVDGVVVWGYCSASGGCLNLPNTGYCDPGVFCISKKPNDSKTQLAKNSAQNSTVTQSNQDCSRIAHYSELIPRKTQATRPI